MVLFFGSTYSKNIPCSQHYDYYNFWCLVLSRSRPRVDFLPPYSLFTSSESKFVPLSVLICSHVFFFLVERLWNALKVHGERDIALLQVDATDAQIDDALDEVCRTTCDKVTNSIMYAADKHNKMSIRGVLI